MPEPLLNTSVAGGKYLIIGRLGQGSFGTVYVGQSTLTRELVAIKLEPKKRVHSQLKNEARLYEMLLRGNKGSVFTPAVYYFGEDGDYNVLVMERLGKSLEELFTYCGGAFSLKTTLMLADQMIERMEHVHSLNIVHRDIKPDNFVMGYGSKAHHLYIIDFGLSREYKKPHEGSHVPYKEGKALIGTARYCSINTHLGVESSRRDDMEGMGHLFIYFLKGSLPWQGLRYHNSKEYHEGIPRKKMMVSVKELCSNLPVEFAAYMNYVRALRFREKPDYNYLRKLFKTLFIHEGYQYDLVYDWTVSKMLESLQREEQREQVRMQGLLKQQKILKQRTFLPGNNLKT